MQLDDLKDKVNKLRLSGIGLETFSENDANRIIDTKVFDLRDKLEIKI
jgi:hypothetical protein